MEGNTVTLPLRPSRPGEPAWEILPMLPRQGSWGVEDYRRLPTDGALVELSNGCLEVLPMPDWLHQTVAFLLASRLHHYAIGGQHGRVVMPPFNLKTVGNQYRHPDVMFLAPSNLHRFRADYWDYADLVIEILSASDPGRDLVEKRAEYARAGIPEYWVIDGAARTVLVLALDGDAYREAGSFGAADIIRSATLPGLDVDFGQLLAEADPPASR